MPAVESKMINLGTYAPDFSLPNTNPNYSADCVSLADFSDTKGFIVAFICNHCPYVVHLKSAFCEFANMCLENDIAVFAISSNDVTTHPMDSPEKMTNDAQQYRYRFPYLYDESQAVARAYGAQCTPDFYVFDSNSRLVYRGQFDDSRPGNGVAVTGADLRAAVGAILEGKPALPEQKPSIGCSIKWQVGSR